MFKKHLLIITLAFVGQSLYAGSTSTQQQNMQYINTLPEPYLLLLTRKLGITIPASATTTQIIQKLSSVNSTPTQITAMSNALYQVQQNQQQDQLNTCLANCQGNSKCQGNCYNALTGN